MASLRSSNGYPSGLNRIRPKDRAVHDWYRFVLSFPPHLVQDYLRRFALQPSDTVLDPFCGTGTTLVECKKLGIASVGIESNPMAHFASSVKVDWSVEGAALSDYADEVAYQARTIIESDGIDQWDGLPMLATNGNSDAMMRQLLPAQSALLLKDSISPVPLHKTLVLLDEIDRHGTPHQRRYGRLALANALVRRIGNLKFGPEVGVGRIKHDAPAVDAWLDCMDTIARDIDSVKDLSDVSAYALRADSGELSRSLKPSRSMR